MKGSGARYNYYINGEININQRIQRAIFLKENTLLSKAPAVQNKGVGLMCFYKEKDTVKDSIRKQVR